jgi:hypothetical protein
MAYHLGLAETQKARMETAGRVALTTEDSQRMQQIRMVYVPVIISGILICAIRRTLYFQMFSGFFMLAIAEVARVLLFDEVKQKPKNVCKQLAMVVARLVVGLMIFFVIGINSMVSN